MPHSSCVGDRENLEESKVERKERWVEADCGIALKEGRNSLTFLSTHAKDGKQARRKNRC
jgi:hypothetical protein